MKITIIANDKDVNDAIKSAKLPFLRKNPLVKIFVESVNAYQNKKQGQKIKAKSNNPDIQLTIEDD